MFREIVDDVRMPVYFWRTLAKYRERYKQLLRVQAIEFDPIVNRYFEAEYTVNSQRKNNGSQETIGSGTNTITSTGTDISKSNNSVTRNVSDVNKDVLDIANHENVDGRTTDYTTLTGDHQNTGNASTTRTNNTTNGNYTKILETSFEDRNDELAKSGKAKDKTTIYKKTIKNSGGIHDIGTNVNNIETSEYSNSIGTNKNVGKQAPMSASGVGNGASITENMEHTNIAIDKDGDISEHTITFDNNTSSNLISLPSNMFDYASKAEQTDDIQHNNSKNLRSEALGVNVNHTDTRQTEESYEGNKPQEVEHSFEEYKEKTTKNGKEKITETYSRIEPELSNGSDTNTHQDTESIRDVTEKRGTNVQKTDSTGKQTSNREGKTTEETSGLDNVDASHSRQDNGRTSNTTNITNNATENVDTVNHNRYTGREGLTPQAGMREAEDYLLGYSPAFQFLIDKLEINFIGVYDL